MSTTRLLMWAAMGAATAAGATAQEPPEAGVAVSTGARGVLLEDLTWMEARTRLTPSVVVVIPLGAAAKEHGPHLPLKNDWTMAEYLKRRVLEQADVVIAPTINYHFYPAFIEYAGSTSLRAETAINLTVDIVRTLARHGPRRFYIINTGVSTQSPLAAASEQLAADGIVLHYTDILQVTADVENDVSEQLEGTHADEIETSMMLYIDPESVDMSKAARDYPSARQGRLTPDPNAPGRYSPSGVYGDATLATREKGEKVVEALVEGILREIEALRQMPLPGASRN